MASLTRSIKRGMIFGKMNKQQKKAYKAEKKQNKQQKKAYKAEKKQNK